MNELKWNRRQWREGETLRENRCWIAIRTSPMPGCSGRCQRLESDRLLEELEFLDYTGQELGRVDGRTYLRMFATKFSIQRQVDFQTNREWTQMNANEQDRRGFQAAAYRYDLESGSQVVRDLEDSQCKCP